MRTRTLGFMFANVQNFKILFNAGEAIDLEQGPCIESRSESIP